jgi:hypothetical protein
MKFRYFIIFIILLISYIYCAEEDIEFKVEKIELPQVTCAPNLATYLFYIKGEFSQSPKITNIIILYLENPPNSKAVCYPLEKTSVTSDQIQCTINTVEFPINNENILLPVTVQNTEGYRFPNWQEVIGGNPGTSNKVPEDNIKCVPKEMNSYDITSIKSQGCSNKKNIILIDGKWKDEIKLVPKEYDFKIKSNSNDLFCKYVNKNEVQCELDGFGEVKFDEQYFKNGVNVFKIEKNDISIKVDQCNSTSFIFMNMVIMLFFLLLMF